MGNPFDFAKPEIKFNKLDDLPKRPHTYAEVIKALKVLHKMVHLQADKYGGKNGKLLPAQIAETSLLASLVNVDAIAEEAELDSMDRVQEAAAALCDHLDDRGIAALGDLIYALSGHVAE